MRIPITATLLALAACASAPLRSDLSGLGRFDTRAVVVSVDGEGDAELHDRLHDGVSAGLARSSEMQPALAGDPSALHLLLHVQRASEPKQVKVASAELPFHIQLADDADRAGRLIIRADVESADGQPLGHMQWDASGHPSDAAPNAGEAIARGLEQAHASGDVAVRRTSDDRLFLTPSAETLRPGNIELSDDELLALRFAAGLGNRVELDGWAGALPMALPSAGGIPMPGAVIGGAGGVAALATVVDLGLKVRVLDETQSRPAIAISYDCLVANVAAVGGVAGGGIGGGGAIVGGGVAFGDVHAQLNIFSAVATKHLGDFQLSAGAYVIDNHNFLPQSAEAAGVVIGGGTDGNSGNANGAGASGRAQVGHLPTEVQPFVSGAYVLGRHSELALEAFPWTSLRPLLGTTGVRWQLGGGERVGPLNLEHVSVRIDAALVWVHLDSTDPQTQQPQSSVGYLPWLGVGVSWL